MSERSYILIENPDKTYKGVYCHKRGDLSYTGALLLKHYSTREKAEELLSYGNRSYLAEEIHPNSNQIHSFDNPQIGVALFYGRDRGERNTQAKAISLQDIESKSSWIRYCYIFGLDGQWRYFEKRLSF